MAYEGRRPCPAGKKIPVRNKVMDFEKVIKDADISKDEVAEIVLVGGSNRVPRIQEILSEYFGKKDLNIFRKGSHHF